MDVITFGEAMIRLAPPNFRRLEQAHSLDIEIGGAELNTAVGLVRLVRLIGRREVCCVRRVPPNISHGLVEIELARTQGVGVVGEGPTPLDRGLER